MLPFRGSNADVYAVTARLSYLFNSGKGKAPAVVAAKYGSDPFLLTN
jgi:hypothetical protein